MTKVWNGYRVAFEKESRLINCQLFLKISIAMSEVLRWLQYNILNKKTLEKLLQQSHDCHKKTFEKNSMQKYRHYIIGRCTQV